MKLLDKFLKVLKTDRNTFFTYILTLLTAYILIDRIVEMLITVFTGMSVSYWGPIKYTLALACPIFAFLLSYPSKLCKSNDNKISFFYTYCVALYIIGISAVVQWQNRLLWIAMFSLPNYFEIITEFSDLIKHAFAAIALYWPIATFYKLILWLYKSINDPIFPNNFKDSICDYSGIDISPTDSSVGAYSLEIELCKDKSSAKPVKILEGRRFQPTLIVGPAGTGKTSMVLEPMIARDLEKKFFFREVSKELGYTALKTKIATLNCPYDNNYINKNFSLSMLTPVEGKEKVYTAFMNKMIYTTGPDGTIVYKNFGITSVSPDHEHTVKVMELAKNFDIPVTVIDPTDSNSIGLNPFIIGNNALCGLVISSILNALYSGDTMAAEIAYMQDLSQQAVQNLVILLKLVYPKMHEGLMPNLEDLLKCFTDFDWVEEMCEELKKDEAIAKDYELQLGYFKQYFYKDSNGRDLMKRYIHFAASQLDVLLRAGSARSIICNRYNNINFTNVINKGEVVLLCSRPFEVGGTAEQSFARFFLTLMMCSVEVMRGTEKTRIPHFLYIDEFDRYASDAFTDMITIYGKFKIGTVFSLQNLSKLAGGISSTFTQTLLSNSATKLSFGNCTPEEYGWWEKEFGERREWVVNNGYDKNDGAYSSNLGGVQWAWKDHMKTAKIQGLAFKNVIYKIKDKKGKNVVNFATVDFLESKYKEPRKAKQYPFNKFVSNPSSESAGNEQHKFKPNKISFDNTDDPIKTDTNNSSYFFNNDDAISFNLKKN